MRLTSHDFDAARASDPGRLFSDEIECDPWVMFHGTSAFNAPWIERDGFHSGSSVVSYRDLQSVVDIYEAMKWVGTGTGSYGALKVYPLGHDYAGQDESLLYFAESSLRAMLYATREFAGGEKLHALRNAFRELDAYLREEATREEHELRMKAGFDTRVKLKAHPAEIERARPVRVDLEWLQRELEGTRAIRQLAEEAYHRHEQGVVYALKMTRDDIEGLHWDHSMGIETAGPIARSKIISKVAVPADLDVRRTAYLRHNRWAGMHTGLLSALTAR